MKIRIITFANLKEYFAPDFELDLYNSCTVEGLKEELRRIKPETSDLLNISRFAINNCFVTDRAAINEKDSVFIIPPSSGG